MSGVAFTQADFASASADYSAHEFLVRQILAGAHTSMLVKVLSCTNSGGASVAGSVSVQPLVNQIDGQGNSTPHGILNQLPYLRMQGGTSAIIMDPVPGDIGLAIFADRDISTVKTTKAQANPGSHRQMDMADGVYLGGLLNGVPTQYIVLSMLGIKMVSPQAIMLQAPMITLDGNVASTGTFMNNSVDIGSPHRHPGVQTGDGITGTPE